jgi:hypothetical protein
MPDKPQKQSFLNSRLIHAKSDLGLVVIYVPREVICKILEVEINLSDEVFFDFKLMLYGEFGGTQNN